MATPVNPADPTNEQTGGTAPSSALQPTATTSPAYNQTAPAAPTTPDMTPFLDVDVSQSNLGEQSELGEDLTSPTSPSFIPETPTDMPEPTKWEVTADQTVAGQFNSIMESDNPVFQQVREEVMRSHAASGGQNSLMASRSAAMAVADVGFKIAAQDAATFAKSAEFNAAMSNQFGLAEQQFRHNALLSEQNFKQGVMMLREQQLADLEKIQADMTARINLSGAQFQFDSALESQKHTNVLSQMDRAHRQNLETMQAQFEYNWQTAEQQQEQALERMDRETANNLFTESQKTNWQMQLNYMSEVGQNSRQLLATVGAIGSNPNITAAQASAAVADAVRQYNAVNAQLASVYTLPSDPNNTAANYMNFSGHKAGYGTNTGSTAPSIDFYGGAPGQPTGGSSAPGTPVPSAPFVQPIAAPTPAAAQPVAAQPIAAPAAQQYPSGGYPQEQWFRTGVAETGPNTGLYNSDPAYRYAWDRIWEHYKGNLGGVDRNEIHQKLLAEFWGYHQNGGGAAQPAAAPAPAPAAPVASGGQRGGGEREPGTRYQAR